MGRRRKVDTFLDPSGLIVQKVSHGSPYAKNNSCERKFWGVGNSVGTNFL